MREMQPRGDAVPPPCRRPTARRRHCVASRLRLSHEEARLRLPGQIAVFVPCALSAFLGVADVASCQSVLDRPPNLSGGWLCAPGTLQFNFVHRFGVVDAPLRKVTNSPTFLLSYQLPLPLLIGFNYATSSDVAAAFPNEWEVFARYGRSGVALQAGYNQAAASVDAELTAAHSVG